MAPRNPGPPLAPRNPGPPRRAVPRRAVLEGGLASLASLLGASLPAAQPLLGCAAASSVLGCGAYGEAAPDAPTTAGEAPVIDAPTELPNTAIPRPALVSTIGALGALGPPDANGVRVPAGCRARIVARSGKPPVAGNRRTWHGAPDGGASFGTPDGGWIYVSNAELPLVGGVSALRFDATGAAVDVYPILEGTSVNCAGGPTPWGTWLSCEEVPRGRVHECDPTGARSAVVRPALGTFKHEAAAVDPVRHHVYLTEDEPDGCFYRFVAEGRGGHGFANLAAGVLEVAEVGASGRVTWRPVPDPTFAGATPTRRQVRGATLFSGGEGIWWHDGRVYFTTKGDERVWVYDCANESLAILYDARTVATPVLRGVDNVTVSASGDVLVAEDGGDMQIVAILPNGELKVLVELVGWPGSEITGPAFDPSGTRLYFSSQRGPRGGTTFEVEGPFHAPA